METEDTAAQCHLDFQTLIPEGRKKPRRGGLSIVPAAHVSIFCFLFFGGAHPAQRELRIEFRATEKQKTNGWGDQMGYRQAAHTGLRPTAERLTESAYFVLGFDRCW